MKKLVKIKEDIHINPDSVQMIAIRDNFVMVYMEGFDDGIISDYSLADTIRLLGFGEEEQRVIEKEQDEPKTENRVETPT